MRRFAAIAALILATPALTAAQEPASAPSLRPALSDDDATQREIEALRAELARISASGRRDEAGLADARERLAALNAREIELSAKLGADRNRLARLLSALQLFRRHPPPALLVSPDDARDAVNAAILVRAILPGLQTRARSLSKEATALGNLRREAAAANAELFTTESALAEQRSDIERLLADAGRDGLFADSPGEMVTSTPPGGRVGGTIDLVPPVDGPISRNYGSPLPAGGRSPGITFEAPRGGAVRAPTAGVVEFVAPVAGWGVVVILRGPGPYHVVLGGLAEASVEQGQMVVSGAPVGKVGDGGNARPELYLELRRGGSPVDPGGALSGTSRRTAAK